MKVKLLNATDTLGAGIACKRLLEAFEGNPNLEGELITQKQNDISNKNIRALKTNYIEKIPYLIKTILSNSKIKKYNPNTKNFSTGLYGVRNLNKLLIESDIIHLQWINDSFISLDGLLNIAHLKKPIFWTLRDLWPITGGCHYPGNCQKFYTYCYMCPVLNSKKEFDLSYNIWSKKKETYKQLNPIFIAPSNWMADQIKKSSLGKYRKNIHVIPNPIDHKIFLPKNKKESRSFFDLPKDKIYLLFGAVNPMGSPRKGFRELTEALKILDQRIGLKNSNVELLIFGTSDNSLQKYFDTKCYVLGNLKSEEALVNAYNAANFFVIPSLEDNHPKTVMEALSCGLPVVGFETGGVPEMIEHNKTGFLAQAGSSNSLASQIENAINLNEEDQQIMQKLAREKVLKNYTYETIANQHLELYNQYLTPSSEV